MAELAEIVALEMSKYLTKEASMADVRKKINGSRAWGSIARLSRTRCRCSVQSVLMNTLSHSLGLRPELRRITQG